MLSISIFTYIFRSTYAPKKYKVKRRRRQCGGGGLMVWGMVMSCGLVAIKVVDHNAYINLMKNFAIKLFNLNFQNYSLVQDNCPVHKANTVKNLFSKESVDTIEWPAYSPDINLMENIWKLLSDAVYSDVNIENMSMLRQRIHNAVLQINQEKREVIQIMFDGIRRRFTNILISKGNMFKEACIGNIS